MIPDTEIIAAVAGRPPVERKRLAVILGIDADAELAATIARLVNEKKLYRTAHPGPGKNTSFVYTVTADGRRDVSGAAPAAVSSKPPPAAAPVQPSHQRSHPMSTKNDAPGRRERIIAYLTGHPDVLSDAIAQHLGVPVEAINRDLWKMKSQGRVRATGDKKPHGYRVVTDSATVNATPAKPKNVPAARAPKSKPARRQKNDALIAPKPAPVPSATQFRVAMTSDDTLLMDRRSTKEQVELQPDEIRVLVAFLSRLDQATTLLR